MASTQPSQASGGLFRRRTGMAWVALWLVFLISPLERIWHHPWGAEKAVAICALLLFAVLYVALFAMSVENRRAVGALEGADPRQDEDPGPHRWAWWGLAGMVLLGALVVPTAGSSSLTLVVYVAAAVAFSVQRRIAVALVLLLAVGTEVAARAVPGWYDQTWSMSFAVLFAGAAVTGIRLAAHRQAQLLRAKEQLAELAVQEERSRISRDLHDILGHSLTVITVKAELAGRLVQLGSDRAGGEIADIERLARDALADVRATIDAQHRVTLPGELSSARAALSAAGIDAELPGAADDVPTQSRELFAWAVREGVTNVVRHSGARRCVVTLSPVSVQIDDDGARAASMSRSAGGDDPRDGGHGLIGLRQRAAASGARVWTGRSRLGGFRLEVVAESVPASGHPAGPRDRPAPSDAVPTSER